MNQLVDYSDSENEQDEKKTQNNQPNKIDLKQNNMQNKPKLIEPDEFFAKFSKKVIENQIKDTNTHNSGFLNKVAQQMQVKNFKEIKRPKTKEEAEYEQEQIVNETVDKIIEKEDEKLDDAPFVNIIKNQNTQKTLNYKRLNPLNLLDDDIEEIMAKKKQKTNIYIEQNEKKRKVPHLNGTIWTGKILQYQEISCFFYVQ
ncbi:hypothetical protein PPERSA_11229 [Pseudocohnilembus persalinus]|uniref:Uncharacterized protein n=1 Tax=Pseudocohnilembus persalinus TaxID=266149 RepID=A0A0V0R058_PSEPJ|nr:hypothetical protein PPERSA_11229 [Pseudocohnilembus persalinus]|eukprot:KRX07680.1 hypothetical protein PPERSA_11229 [Pseudocohnilembus persalinus]